GLCRRRRPADAEPHGRARQIIGGDAATQSEDRALVFEQRPAVENFKCLVDRRRRVAVCLCLLTLGAELTVETLTETHRACSTRIVGGIALCCGHDTASRRMISIGHSPWRTWRARSTSRSCLA